jgi:hypothetical protein
MIITESHLRSEIRKEIQKVLLEAELKSFIRANISKKQMLLFRESGKIPADLVENIFKKVVQKYGPVLALTAAIFGAAPQQAMAAAPEAPPAATQSFEDAYDNEIEFIDQRSERFKIVYNRAVDSTRQKIKEKLQDDDRSELFLAFARSMESPTFKDMSDEDVKGWYVKNLKQKYLDLIDNVEFQNTIDNRDEMPDNVKNLFASDDSVGGLYDSDTGVIYLNPHSFLKNRDYRVDTMSETIMEEIFHMIDGNIKVKDIFPSLAGKPQGEIPFATSLSIFRAMKEKDVIVSQEESGLDSSTYQYLTTPQELYAKLQVVKDKLGDDFFDEETGAIDMDALKDLLDADSENLPADFRIFQIFKKDKAEEIKSIFDQLVRADDAEQNLSQYA